MTQTFAIVRNWPGVMLGVLCTAFLLTFPAFAEESANANDVKYAAEISEVERRGRLIFEKDRAAWLATDHFLANSKIATDDELLGWITEKNESGGFVVSFIVREGERVAVRYSVAVVEEVVQLQTSETLSPGRALTNRQRLMFNARSLALSSEFQTCAQSYNTVVLEISDTTTFHVYLMPALSSLDELPIGGHTRFLIGGEVGLTGSYEESILEQRAFTRTCLTLPKSPNAVALVTTHVTAPYPEEPHVFLSILGEIDIYVLTTQNDAAWKVSNGKIEATEL